MVEYWLRRPPGSVSAHPNTGYDFVGDEENRLRLREHGYETVSDNTQRMIGYPPNHRFAMTSSKMWTLQSPAFNCFVFILFKPFDITMVA